MTNQELRFRQEIGWPLAQKHRPKGWSFVETRVRDADQTGLADADHCKLFVPRIVRPMALGVALHECAHVNLKHFETDKRHHEEEFEAWSYALEKLAGAKVKLSTDWRRHIRLRVRAAIDQDLLHGEKMNHYVIAKVATEGWALR